MKKLVLTLTTIASLVSLVSCSSSEISNLKVESKGHFTDEQLNYLKSEDYTNTSPYNGNMKMSKPNPVRFTWNGGKGEYYFTFINDYDNKEIGYFTDSNPFDFYNPIIGAGYLVKIKYKDYEEQEIVFREDVQVPGPRNIYIDGVENMRDIGGWGRFNADGKYVTYMRQGRLYRSGRFNEDKEETVKPSITKDGMYDINLLLGIKTEIDLRKTSTNEVGGLTNKSVLGDKVNYLQLPMAYNGNNILTFKGKINGDDYEYDNPAMIKRFFEILADKDNYPIDFHCSIGKDRTGCLAYLVEGLMGFEQEHMYRDYMFTNFADAGMCKITDITDRYGKTIDEYSDGDTLQKKVFNYLNKEVGVSADDLYKVITNLIA